MTVTENDLFSFGALLKSFRTRRRLTQQQLAQAIGVHRSTIIRWELGDFLPESKALVLELARHLHLDELKTRHLLEASLTALSPHWHVPFQRNPFFTGREEILEALHTQLGGNQAVALTQSSALHGLGGVGKTQLAQEYAYRHALEYSAVFWIGAETSENIISSLLHIAEVLQLPGRDDKDQQHVVAAVQHWLTTHSQWLLIWDNVEDLALLDRFLPSTRQGAILITTRRQVLGTLARGIDMLPMEREEGMLFLLRRAKVLESEVTSEQVRQLAAQMSSQYAAAAELVIAMGGLPLALDQAGAYIEETKCSLPAYLELFRTRRATLLQQRGEGSRHHPESVATTFTLAITATAERHPTVWDLLRICALLQPDAIPEELLRQGAEHLGATLEAACCDTLEWNRVVAIACSYSLLYRQAEEQTLSMHRLVQAVLLDAMTEAELLQWQQRTVHLLNAVFPEITSRMGSETWGQCERLLPHVMTCVATIPDNLQDQELADMLLKAGYYLYERFQDGQAELLHQRALRLLEQMLGSEHPRVATSLCKLAFLYRAQGRYEQAEPLFQHSLRLLEQALGPEHPQVADPLTGLAMLYKTQGKYEQAESLYQRALRIQEQALGPEHPDVAPPLNNLAMLYCDLGKYKQAEPLGQRALCLFEQALGPEDPSVAFMLDTVATLYRAQGKYEQAEPVYQRALRLFEALGPEDLRVAHPLNGLAMLRYEQGEDEEAESLYQRALQIRERHLGPQHPDVADLLNNLGDLYREQGKYEQAEPLYQRALSIREQHLGQHHPKAAQTLHDLALFQQKQGNLSEALSFAQRARSIRSQSLGDAHPKTIATRTLHTQLVNAHLPLSIPSEEAENVSGPQSGSQTRSRTQDRLPIQAMHVVVRGATRQVAYIRNVRMREVTFTCTICGQTITQLHYPSGRIKYCSDACRTVRAAQLQEVRVARQREKRRTEREAHLRSQQQHTL